MDELTEYAREEFTKRGFIVTVGPLEPHETPQVFSRPGINRVSVLLAVWDACNYTYQHCPHQRFLHLTECEVYDNQTWVGVGYPDWGWSDYDYSTDHWFFS